MWTITLTDRARALPAQQVALAALISAGALALGSIGPWATASVENYGLAGVVTPGWGLYLA